MVVVVKKACVVIMVVVILIKACALRQGTSRERMQGKENGASSTPEGWW